MCSGSCFSVGRGIRQRMQGSDLQPASRKYRPKVQSLLLSRRLHHGEGGRRRVITISSYLYIMLIYVYGVLALHFEPSIASEKSVKDIVVNFELFL